MTGRDFEAEFLAIVGDGEPADSLIVGAAKDSRVQQEAYRKLWKKGMANAQVDPALVPDRLTEIAAESRQRMAPIIGSLGVGEAYLDLVIEIADDHLWRSIEEYVH